MRFEPTEPLSPHPLVGVQVERGRFAAEADCPCESVLFTEEMTHVGKGESVQFRGDGSDAWGRERAGLNLFFVSAYNGPVGHIVDSLVGVCSVYVGGFEVEDSAEPFEMERVDPFSLRFR